MSDDVEQSIEARYQRSFGRVAGYLPKNRAAVDAWLKNLAQEVAKRRARGGPIVSPSVAALALLIERNGIVRMYVTQMINQVPPKYKHIQDIPDLLAALELIITTAPEYSPIPADQNFFPVSTLFTYMMMTPSGEAAFRYVAFNEAIRAILQEWCAYLDSAESQYVLNEGVNGWLSPPAYKQNKLYEFEIPNRGLPHWGFPSFNAYFHRQIKPECRPIAAPDNPKVIVSANDGTVVTYVSDVQAQANFWIKGQPYSLINMLNGSEYTERFIGGDVFQSFLSGADYHRWHSPIDGVIRSAEVVGGLMFSDAESAGFDPTAATYSQGYEASVNTRGLVFVESPDPVIGMVCVMPIGITEISSVTLEVKAGDPVKKGQELGYFSYGGSSMALVFQRGAIDFFTVPQNTSGNQDDGPPIYVNAEIAIAK
ncbi:MAG TPA: phosphatidylserine decarboxylase family protein [Thermoanaerobaculia bacterium]|nr:phosphatidylserine decarboxylase family protein [Thermoanaerobaculia bacterium]